jgi:hypothetical protein
MASSFGTRYRLADNQSEDSAAADAPAELPGITAALHHRLQANTTSCAR